MKNLPKTRLSLVLAGIAIYSVYVFIFYNKGLVFEDWSTIQGDALPSIENPSHFPKTRPIFFHETSYHGELTARQACAVEAAARAHPHWQVHVLFSSPVTDYTLKTSCLASLLQLHNVKLLRVHLTEYSKGTVVQSIIHNDSKNSRFPAQHLADILRILTLNKWGGVCLDTDMVVVKSLEALPSNWIVTNEEKFVTSGILSFAKDQIGSNITNSMLKEIFETYSTDDWSATGQRVIQKVIQRMYPVTANLDSRIDLKVFSYEMFYPNNFKLWKLSSSSNIKQTESIYSFQMWDFLSVNGSIIKHVPYDKLARKYCPLIFGSYGEDFGF